MGNGDTSDGCLSDLQLQHLVEGELPAHDESAARDHMQACAKCTERHAIALNALQLLDQLGGRSDLIDLHNTRTQNIDESRRTRFLNIEGYKVIRQLSEGGQGVVYQALQHSTKRKVAINTASWTTSVACRSTSSSVRRS